MHEFLNLSSPAKALETILQTLPDREPVAENINTLLALGRVIVGDVRSPHPLPEFPRSTVDGYAVRARDTFGVSESLPGYLILIGEVLMGASPIIRLTTGTCALIHTGGMLPAGADAVIMLEYTQQVMNLTEGSGSLGRVASAEIEVLHPIAAGENVLRVGEDVTTDQVVLQTGTRIRPTEIGGCMALGITILRVAKQPLVGIISSGDEVIPPETIPHPGQVRDVNSYLLAALVRQAGGVPVLYGIVPDKLIMLKNTAAKAMSECDLVVITAGSSTSVRDMTEEVIASLGAPGVLVHGLNVRPGKPTILAVCDGKAVIGLPGNPVSTLVIARLTVVPVVERLLGAKPKPKPSVLANLTVNVPSQAGREDWVAVKLIPSRLPLSSKIEMGRNDGQGWLAEPVFGKSNLIFTLAAADGLIRILPDVTGVSAGDEVEVILI
jgi:molybdopterin molybdotransferase